MKHIELFAGCGGLCLGLNKAGFDLTMANELSPMAAETFSYNMLGEDIAASANYSKTLWLSSKYSKETDFKSRLREDPREYPDPINNSDLKDDISDNPSFPDCLQQIKHFFYYQAILITNLQASQTLKGFFLYSILLRHTL